MQARFLSAMVALALPAAPALADSRAESPRHIPLGAESEAPRGYVEMCAANAGWCAAPAPRTPDNALASERAQQGGSAFPVILSLNFAVPTEMLVAIGEGARMRLAGVDLDWSGSLAATVGASASVAQGAAAAERDGMNAQLGKNTLALLKTVNRRVNGAVVQRTDRQAFGQGELWRRSGVGPRAVGDCEDIAIEKRLQLIAEGFPADKLAYAVVYQREAGLHTVLVAQTDAGDVVLDSRTPYVHAWTKVPYVWISIQSMEDPARWFALGRRSIS